MIVNKAEMHTKAGTPYYISPEVLDGKYDKSCDIWSCGVILFILLSGLPPFYGRNDKEILKMVKSRKFSFDIPEFQHVSEEAKDLIRLCLEVPEKRPSAQEVLQHKWMHINLPKTELNINVNQLSQFNSHSRLKKVALSYIAA